MASYSPRQERHQSSRDILPAGGSQRLGGGMASRSSRLLHVPARSPPPIPPRNYAPLPRELLSKELEKIWGEMDFGCAGHEHAIEPTAPKMRLELERSSLRQRRLAARNVGHQKSLLNPALNLHRDQPAARRCVYRRPALVLKNRPFPSAPRYRNYPLPISPSLIPL